MNRNELLAKYRDPIPVLDHGYIRLVDVMGSPDADTAVLEAARTSTGAGPSKHKWTPANGVGEECAVCGAWRADGESEVHGTEHCEVQDQKLIRHLFRHKHMTPFEACNIKIEVKLPIFVERQWVRHRSAWLNEVSARYQQLPSEFYVPEVARMQLQSTDNRQGSGGALFGDAARTLRRDLGKTASQAHMRYAEYNAVGLTRELARINLPLSTYTQKIWGTSLRMCLHFLGLRADPHAQWEIRQYAEVMCDLLMDWAPHTAQAFLDYDLNAYTFSAQELEVLRLIVSEWRCNNTKHLRFLFDNVEGVKPTIRERRHFRRILDFMSVED